MALSASAKLCIFWYMILLAYFGICIWRKYRFQNRPILLSPWIFLSLIAGISALFTSLMGAVFLPLAVELAAGIVIGFIHPIFAASFFLTTFLLKPWELLPATELMIILPRCLATLAFASLLAHLARARKSEIFFNGGVALFFAFMTWIFLSAVTAYNSAEAIDEYGVAIFPIVATFLLIINSAGERLDLEIIRGGLVIAVLALTSIAIVRTLWDWGFNFSSVIPRLEGEGQWANANDLAALMVLVIPLIFFPLVARSRSVLNRIFGLSISVFLLFGIWLSQSRAAILAVVLGFLAHYLCARKLTAKQLLPIILILLAPVIFLSTIQRDSSDTAGSNSMRLEYLMTGLRMLKSNPITGVGFDNYSDLFERYTTKFDEYGKRTAHSSWVLALAETGIPGFILLMSLYIYVLRRAYQLRKQLPEQLVAIVSYGFCMSLLSHTYQLAPYVLFAWILSSKRLLAPEIVEPIQSNIQVLQISA